MITLLDKKNCSGCSACAQRCPKRCVKMQQDSEGFLYPLVDKNSCIECGLCENVCPYNNQDKKNCIKGVYAAKNENEHVRMQSSSGGIFSLLAEKVISEGGVVFGARFNKDWQVEHSYTEDLEGLAAFRGSKYVQSVVGVTYIQAEQFLKEGRKVLYSGTPCQIAGLKHYLRKEYDNLLAVECVCHSVPSPLVWKKFLDQHRNGRIVRKVNFRDKSTGWSNYKYSLVIYYENGDKEIIPGGQPYMKALTANLSTRPSCSNCKVRNGRSGADLALGDFWGVWDIAPKLDDNKGISIIIAYSDRGHNELNKIKLNNVTISDAIKYNRGLCASIPLHQKRDGFFKKIKLNNDIDSAIDCSLQETLLEKLKRKVRSI